MKTQITMIHLGGIALIIVCAVVADRLLSSPMMQTLLVACATGLYGALGFAPLKPVREKIVLNMPSHEVERIQSLKPPPHPPTAPGPPTAMPPAGV